MRHGRRRRHAARLACKPGGADPAIERVVAEWIEARAARHGWSGGGLAFAAKQRIVSLAPVKPVVPALAVEGVVGVGEGGVAGVAVQDVVGVVAGNDIGKRIARAAGGGTNKG